MLVDIIKSLSFIFLDDAFHQHPWRVCGSFTHERRLRQLAQQYAELIRRQCEANILTFIGVYLLFSSTNGNSCCRGNIPSLWVKE